MMRDLGRRLTLVTALVLTASGCFRLARTSPPVQRYVLGGGRIPVGPTAPDSNGLTLGLRRLDLAPYLSTLAIVVRRSDNEIVTSGFHRWAEGPSAGLNRALSGYLAASPGVRSVDVAPWPIRSDHAYLVQIHVARLEGVVGAEPGARRGEAHLLARWEILRARDGAMLARGETDHRAPGWVVDDYAGLVARIDQGLIVLTQELLACVARLGLERPGDAGTVEGELPVAIDCVQRAPRGPTPSSLPPRG